VQFDEQPPELVRGPAHAEHTEPVLKELGLDADRILELRQSGVIG
jgi:crotonobetainyl-CoA:carnitine CoA-transferase CaiB-like acyl-CoA transferase